MRKTIKQMKNELGLDYVWRNLDEINQYNNIGFLFSNVFEAYCRRMSNETNINKYKLMNIYYPYFKKYVDNKYFNMPRPVMFKECLEMLAITERKIKIDNLKKKMK
jgi:hypothetical protein